MSGSNCAHLVAQSLLSVARACRLFINSKRNSESARTVGIEDSGSQGLVLLRSRPLSVFGLLVAGEGLCVP